MSEEVTAVEILAGMERFADWPERVRADLAAQARLIRIDEAKRLMRGQLTKQRLFLVDGSVQCASRGLERQLDSCLGLSDPVELFDDIGTGEDTVVTQGSCLMLALPTSALAAAERASTEATEIDDIELDDAAGGFLDEFYARIHSGCLDLPARPEVALHIQKLTSDPDAGVAELTELIQSDATLAGAVLHAVNSASLRAAQDITSIHKAVVRLGFANTRVLATNLALRQVFRARHRATQEAMTQVWTDSVLRSTFSYLLAKKRALLDPDRALLAGLLASVGAVPIIQFFDQQDDVQLKREDIEARVASLMGITGVLVINYWELGADLVNVAEQGANWHYRASEPDYASLSLVGRWAALAYQDRSRPPAADVPAFQVLGMQTPLFERDIVELQGSEPALEHLQSLFAL